MQIFPTRMYNVTAWRHTGLRAHWPMTLVAGGWGGGGGNSPGNCSVSYLSFPYGSTGGVCGRSLTEGKILFTGREPCSLYLVLWLCGCKAFVWYKLINRIHEYRLEQSNILVTCNVKAATNISTIFLFYILLDK